MVHQTRIHWNRINVCFKQYLNEFIYVVHNKYQQLINRKIAIEEEEAIRIYLMNLKKDFEALVILSKPKTLTKTELMAIGI